MFLFNAKPSFEIAKWMAKHMLWQNMKINKIMQKIKKPKNLPRDNAISRDGLALYRRIRKQLGFLQPC